MTNIDENTYLMRFPEISSDLKSKKSRVSFRKTWCCSHFHSGCPGHWEKVVHVVHTYVTWLGKKRSLIYKYHSKQSLFNGCFTWMIPSLYLKNGCFNKHPIQNG